MSLLATANAQLITPVSFSPVRLLIDSGSELTFVKEELITQLNIPRVQSSISITGLGGARSLQTRGIALLTLRSNYDSTTIQVQAHVLKALTSNLPSVEAPHQEWPHLDGLKLADPDFLTPRPIDMVIGADTYGQIIKPNLIKADPSMPIAQFSMFGWLILGPITIHKSQISTSHHSAVVQPSNNNLQEMLTRFWIQEELPGDTPTQLTHEEEECEEHFRATHSRDSTGRYIVRIPLKLSPKLLGNSYKTAHACLMRMRNRLRKDAGLRDLYEGFMNEYKDLQHMVRASSISPNAHSIFYLPHHGVLKPDSQSTKLRVVFNGSSPSGSGHSINDLMHTGKNLLLNVTDVLLWIRQHKFIFATDVTKMYRQVQVHEADQDLQRVLWFDGNQKEVPYKLTTVTYGLKAAPFLAVRALLQLVEDEGHRFPLAVPSLTQARYVDDIFGGADTGEKLIEIAQQLKDLCNAGGFPLAKWHATHPPLLDSISPTQRALGSILSLDDCKTKVLGLHWNVLKDSFSFSAKPTMSSKFTKRLILSEVAQIFDPLGFLSPVIIQAKVLLQELWLHKLSWDDPLPSQVTSKWLTIRENLQCLARLSVPRWFTTYSYSTVELHGFSDASQLAMAAVVYITVLSPSTNHKVSTLVCSKTKVAPLKKLTIPRLELTASLMLAKLTKYVQATLQLNVAATHLWTDSQVTLIWIKSHASRWKDYVRNRVSQIQELTQHAQWRHVPGTSNPADCASRGVTTSQLEQHKLWWTGPPWLTQPSDSWPSQPELKDDSSAQEARPGVSTLLNIQKIEYHWDLIYRYSSLNKLIRITSVCFRILDKLRRAPISLPIISHSPEDLERARIFWIKATQALYFNQELKTLSLNSKLPSSHAFNRLTAFVDEQGVIRVGGRLNNAHMDYGSKHPVILPRNSRLSHLIIDNAHKTTLHGGTQLTLSHIRQRYWILGGRAPVKTHVLRCVVCARHRGIRAHQLMGQLPLARVTPSQPFTRTGLDYAGPISLKAWKGRGSKIHKGWICVFTCLTTSAVHLELVTDYSTEGFIATYRRFISRRGIPQSLHSDCGTNFIGADAALKRLFTQGSKEHHSVSQLFVNDNTKWLFNPPAAPHMGGKWEAVVKSIKHHLRRTVSDTALTYEEFSTLLTQIEAMLNSRPLEPLSDDSEDITPLTPAHFLIGQPLSTLPEPSADHSTISPSARWQLIQQKAQRFWTQWSSQYLQRQLSISKWLHPSNDIKIGSLVLITDERFPPSKWPLARVLTTHPGKDGLTRVATLKTATTVLKRPIAKLAPLNVSGSSSTSSGSC